VIWDAAQGRFLFALSGDSQPSVLDVGWSKSDTPNAAGDWCSYRLDLGYGSRYFPDFPKLGDTQNFLLIGVNVVDSSTGKTVRSDVVWLSKPTGPECAPSVTATRITGLTAADGGPLSSIVPAAQTDPGSTNWIVAVPFKDDPRTTLCIFAVTEQGGRPRIQRRATDVTVNAYSTPPAAPQAGSTSLLGTFDGRLTQAVAGFDPGRGRTVIWTQHTIASNNGSRAQVRWYEIDGVAPAILQTGTIHDPARFVFNAAIAPDRAVGPKGASFGDSFGISFTTSSSAENAVIWTAWKSAAEPLSEWTQIVASPGANFDKSCNPTCKWGDYPGASPDPVMVEGATYGQVWFSSQWNAATVDDRPDWRTWNWNLAIGSGERLPLWETRYDGGTDNGDGGEALAVSPDGSKVFVTGWSVGADYATIAYDPSTGAELWVARYNGPAGAGSATSIAVSLDGSRVFVAGRSIGEAFYDDYATVAYDAATGAELWVARYNGPGNKYDFVYAVGVSSDGSKVFVTGSSDGGSTGWDYATVAYDASTGAQLWLARYNGPGNGFDTAYALSVSPDGTEIVITGEADSGLEATGWDYATVAYDASTGAQLWLAIYDGGAIPTGPDEARAIVMSTDGSQVLVTGMAGDRQGGGFYGTIAYDASTGGQLWVSKYTGPGDSSAATALQLSPNGSSLFVTGYSAGSTGLLDYATVAYDSATGTLLWAARYTGPGTGGDPVQTRSALGVSPDGSMVFITGSNHGQGTYSDYATLGYDAGTGAERWVGRYDGPGSGYDYGFALGVSSGRVDGVRHGRGSSFAGL
jgi:WD40 repeat protein